MHLDTFTQILGISNYKVTHIIRNTEKEFCFYLTRINDNVPARCSNCGRSHDKIHDVETVTVEDLPISNKKVFFVFDKRKLKCDEDGTVRVEEFDWLVDRHTRRYCEQVNRLTTITSNQEAGWFLKTDDEVIYRIDKKILEEQALDKLEPLPASKNISVDEVAFQKWHKYVTNVIDVDERAVVWNAKDRGKEVLSKYYFKLGKNNCSKIETVAMDGASGFISATKENAPQALLVYDRFHISQKLNKAVDEVRRNELRLARKNGDIEQKDLLYCGERWILLKNKKLTKNQQSKLNKLKELNQNIATAMILKEDFLSIYNPQICPTPEESESTLIEWLIEAGSSNLEPFKELAESFARKFEMIINYFKKKISSAISEGINNKIKRLKRIAYGYRDMVYFLLKVHQHCGLLNPRRST